MAEEVLTLQTSDTDARRPAAVLALVDRTFAVSPLLHPCRLSLLCSLEAAISARSSATTDGLTHVSPADDKPRCSSSSCRLWGVAAPRFRRRERDCRRPRIRKRPPASM